MNGLITIAKQFNAAFIIPHHFIKGVRSAGTVQAAIGGMGVVYNVPKSVYIFGPDSPGAKSTKALAPQKFNYGRHPVTLHFQLESWEQPFKGRLYEMSRLEYLGPIDAKAADIFDAAKFDERGSKRTGIQEATEFIVDYFRVHGRAAKGNPSLRLARTSALEEEAQKAGLWFSKGTFGRARDAAGVRPVLAGELERLLGNEEALFISDKRGWVAAVIPQEEPPLYPPEPV
jgi:hypothetical protein